MADFLDVVPRMKDYFTQAGIQVDEEGFEKAYSRIAEDPAHSKLASKMEKAVYEYFESLELPRTPTLYDYLLLSLRGKDVIATFNWDPFLLQAARRCRLLKEEEAPRLLFLHGNVQAGFCPTCSVLGHKGNRCSQCRKEFEPSRLLYPIANKDYRSDPMIASQWDELEQLLKDAFMVTIFGYGAPASDKAAVDILKGAWGPDAPPVMEQFEIIDIRDETALLDSWDPFIHTHHYEVHTDFYDSWIAQHPRRTGEAYLNQYIEAKWISNNDIPTDLDFPGIREWYKPLVERERNTWFSQRGYERLVRTLEGTWILYSRTDPPTGVGSSEEIPAYEACDWLIDNDYSDDAVQFDRRTYKPRRIRAEETLCNRCDRENPALCSVCGEVLCGTDEAVVWCRHASVDADECLDTVCEDCGGGIMQACRDGQPPRWIHRVFDDDHYLLPEEILELIEHIRAAVADEIEIHHGFGRSEATIFIDEYIRAAIPDEEFREEAMRIIAKEAVAAAIFEPESNSWLEKLRPIWGADRGGQGNTA